MSAPPPAPIARRADAALRQPSVIAVLVALAIASTMALLVLGPWGGGGARDGGGPPATLLAAVASPILGPTPTARAIRPNEPATAGVAARRAAIVAPTPQPRPSATKDDAGPAIAPRPGQNEESADPPPTRRPAPSATSAPAPTATPEPVLDLSGAREIGGLATGSWTVEGDQLISSGPFAAEPWIVAPDVQVGSAFAVEGEFRVRELTPDFCAQSFGLVAGDPSQSVWGGGFYYPCGSPQSRARITDVTNPGDGYNGDLELAVKTFDLGDGWHTFRLEFHGDDLQFLVDGDTVATTTVDRGNGPSSIQVGAWSQGVRVAMRRLSLYKIAPIR